MAWLYGMLLISVIWEAVVAGFDFHAGNWGWGLFWLGLSMVSMALVVSTYDTFVA